MKKRYHLLLFALACAVAAQSQVQRPTAWLRADSAVLNPRSYLDRDDIGRTFAHEGGHIYYEVTDPAGYKEWLDRNMISPDSGYDGHGKGDPSGDEAKKWEKAY